MNQPKPIVLDSSVAIAIVRDEPGAPAIRAALDAWSLTGRSLLVPAVFWLEIANVLARKHRYVGQDVLHAIHELDELTVTTIESDRTQLLVTIDLVERFGLTSYDAAYLALTQLYSADLATLDVELARAAGVRAIPLDARRRPSETRTPYEHAVTWPDFKGASSYLAKLRVEAREATPWGRANAD